MNFECYRVGNIRLVKKLGTPKNSVPIGVAAQYGHLDVVKYLISVDSPITHNTITYAAINGHLDIIKYLTSINAPIISLAINYAIREEQLEVIKYLIEIDAPTDENTAIYALEYSLHILKLLLLNGVTYKKPYKIIEKIQTELYMSIKLEISELIGSDITGIICTYLWK